MISHIWEEVDQTSVKHVPAWYGNFRGTCWSVEMLKGYVIKERLEIPVI